MSVQGEAGREMDARVAEFMEPQPEAVPASALRATYKGWEWYSTHRHPSPLGWWEAEIGTDHGGPEDDDKPVTWLPAREPSVDIGAAWEVVEAMKARQWHMGVEVMGRTQYRARATFSGMWTNGSRRPYRDAVADCPALAICKAALQALESRP